jgi:hypothetical protein
MVTVTEHAPDRVRMFTELPPDTGYVRPTREQLHELRRKVLANHPELGPIDELEFLRAFWVQGAFFRIPLSEQKRSFAAIFDDAKLKLSGFGEVSSQTFLAACIAASDIEVRLPDRGVGQLLEIGLNPFSGRQCDNRMWQAVAAGTANLPSPMPPRAEYVHRAARGQPQATFWKRDEGGALRSVGPDERLWSRSRS